MGDYKTCHSGTLLLHTPLFRPPLAPPNLGGEIGGSWIDSGGEIGGSRILPLSQGELEGV